MRIAVTHLTRMQRGYICVAGVDVVTGRNVRPVVSMQRLREQLLARHGGPFDMATIVDLGATTPSPHPPETEDHEFSPWRATAVRPIEPSLYWEMLEHLARRRLVEIFGVDLRRCGAAGAAVDVDSGHASLGYLALGRRPRLCIRQRPEGSAQVRMRATDGEFDLDLSVTDIRLYGDDHATPDDDAVHRVIDAIDGDEALILSVGLTRPFSPTPNLTPVHWLQVNNIHLGCLPDWRLGGVSRDGSQGLTDPDLNDMPF